MKKYILLAVTLLAATTMMTSCSKERYWLSDGMWKMIDDYGNQLPPSLTFNGETVAVQGVHYDYQPLEDRVWDYYIDAEDEEMVIYFDEDYYDGDTWTSRSETYRFDFELFDNDTRMRLKYDPLIGSDKVYYFVKVY